MNFHERMMIRCAGDMLNVWDAPLVVRDILYWLMSVGCVGDAESAIVQARRMFCSYRQSDYWAVAPNKQREMAERERIGHAAACIWLVLSYFLHKETGKENEGTTYLRKNFYEKTLHENLFGVAGREWLFAYAQCSSERNGLVVFCDDISREKQELFNQWRKEEKEGEGDE